MSAIRYLSPFFLISVGMLINLKVIANGPTAMIIATTLTIVALVGKYFAAMITGAIFRLSEILSKFDFWIEQFSCRRNDSCHNGRIPDWNC